MTERELLDHICQSSGTPARGSQPPYSPAGIPLHPDRPVDYEREREEFVEAVLGKCDFVYHPALGCPHVDICRYPATSDRPFCVYLTNGMSDFPLMLPDGTSRRIELAACTRCIDTRDLNAPDSITQIVRYISIFPFMVQTFLDYYHTIELPSIPGKLRTRFVVLIPPFLLPGLATLRLMGQEVRVISFLPLRDQECEKFNQGTRVAEFVESLPDNLETWLYDSSPEARGTPRKRGFLSRLWS